MHLTVLEGIHRDCCTLSTHLITTTKLGVWFSCYKTELNLKHLWRTELIYLLPTSWWVWAGNLTRRVRLLSTLHCFIVFEINTFIYLCADKMLKARMEGLVRKENLEEAPWAPLICYLVLRIGLAIAAKTTIYKDQGITPGKTSCLVHKSLPNGLFFHNITLQDGYPSSNSNEYSQTTNEVKKQANFVYVCVCRFISLEKMTKIKHKEKKE